MANTRKGKLTELKPDPKNANKGTERGRWMLEESLRTYGAGRSVLVDKNGVVIAGNKTVEAAVGLGLDDTVVVETDGKQVVVVQRKDLDLIKDPKAVELALADNRAAEVGLAFDLQTLQALKGDGLADLSKFWSEDELKGLAAQEVKLTDEPEGGGVPAAPKVAITKKGDLWKLGDHRLLCGDSTKVEDVARLMGKERARMIFTDPPWNVAIGKDSNPKHRQREGLENDDLGQDFGEFLQGWAGACLPYLSGDIYCVMGCGEWPAIDTALRGNGMHWSATIIWVKDVFVLGRSNYHRRFEPIWYGWPDDAKSSFNGERNQDDIWEYARPKVSEEHPTMKPVELVARAIQNSSFPKDVVMDPFLGAGSTVIAAQAAGRRCFGLEISPNFCDVIVQRWQEATGAKAEREPVEAEE